MTHFYEENPPDAWEECPTCECYHPQGFTGDCREDSNRWPSEKAIELLMAHPLPEDKRWIDAREVGE